MAKRVRKAARRSVVERLAANVMVGPPHVCWLWEGARDWDGYGRIKRGRRVVVGVHRLVAELCLPNPDGWPNVLHSCDQPSCVNPHHLRWGTDADNAADRCARGRQPRGAVHGLSKLTEVSAMAIYRAEGTCAAIAARFGVSPRSVRGIKLRQTWRHIHDQAAP